MIAPAQDADHRLKTWTKPTLRNSDRQLRACHRSASRAGDCVQTVFRHFDVDGRYLCHLMPIRLEILSAQAFSTTAACAWLEIVRCFEFFHEIGRAHG